MKLVAVRFRVGVGGLVVAALAIAAAVGAGPAGAATHHVNIDCLESSLCAEVGNYGEVFGANYYVGHDEPTATFYSNRAGSGNRMRYVITLPTDPSPANPSTKSYNFQLNGALWFGMALCDTQSYPEQISTCKPDSDKNIVDPAKSPNHPGTAFTELQFYPPGWVKWPAFQVAVGAGSCDPTKWCAAMNVFSLLEDPVNGTAQNASCVGKLGGSIETFEFAFVTRNGRSQAPANPLDSTLQTFTPDPTQDLFMNSGDRIQVTMHDTEEGVRAELVDLTTGQQGSMTASPANGFAQFKYDPTGTSCAAIPYAFHPMYSTSSEKTRVIWAAHSNNIGFTSEIGHWQSCNGAVVPATQFGVDQSGNPISCPSGNTEEDGEPTEDPAAGGDDNFCFPASQSSLVQLQGCTDTNTGFDGVDYHAVWPDGNTQLHPTSVQFTSPLTGPNYSQRYQRAGLEADLPRIEVPICNRSTGVGCTLIPQDDEGQPAEFYPYFSIASSGRQCVWQFGSSIPGTTNDFGKNAGYGSLLANPYLILGGGGASHLVINDFRNVFSNPCPAQSDEHR